MSTATLPTIRCWNCNLNQFLSKLCRKCHQPLARPEPVEIEVGEVLAPVVAEVSSRDQITYRIAKRIKAARKRTGLSQRALAKILDRPRTYFSKIENAKVQPILHQLEIITNALGITMVDLVETERERAERRIFADQFMVELMREGKGLTAFHWKKIADGLQKRYSR